MKIALYFILFVGFMTIVTVIDHYSKGPMIAQYNNPIDEDDFGKKTKYDINSYLGKRNSINAGSGTYGSKSQITSNSRFGRQVTTAGSNTGGTKVTAGSGRGHTQITSSTKFKKSDNTLKKENSRNIITADNRDDFKSVVTASSTFSKSVLVGQKTKEPKKSQIPSARPIILLLFICYPFFRGHILEYKKADDRLF